ncbi:MAG: DUF2520 domain-containing protein [candidate division KSB1 bacterium]|nr:DUF2520 domain-containing protein [candidate division KSB1 bacterium]
MDTERQPAERVAVVGAGRVGRSLAVALCQNGVEITAVVDQDLPRAQSCAARVRAGVSATSSTAIPAETTTIVVAVPDDALERVAAALLSCPATREGLATIHTSGALGAEVFDSLRSTGVSAASAHPIMTFAGSEEDWRLWAGTFVGIEGDDEARRRASSLMRRVGAIPVELPTGQKALYHLACVFASNYVVALYSCAARTLVQLGIEEPTALRLLAPLTARTVANITAQGPLGALTGPIARGDVGTVRRHLDALAASEPLRSVYVALGKVCVELARAQGGSSMEDLEAIDTLLNAYLNNPR